MSGHPSEKQRRRRRIALSPSEIDAFLGAARTCRVATVGRTGPHVSPLWFVWQDGAVWLSSLVNSQRFKDLQSDPRVAIVVDDGHEYGELRGVELSGRAVVVGEVPRIGEDVPELVGVERAQASKYGRDEMRYDGRHAWLRVEPTKLVSWDHRRIPPPAKS